MNLSPCLSAVALLLLARSPIAAEADGVKVEGVVTYLGPLPKPVPVAEAQLERHPIERDARTNGIKEAVVWIEGLKAPARKPPKKTVMDQSMFFFVPHVLAVEVGQEVEFLNSDGANHGVLASSSEKRNSFDVITPPGGSYKRRFLSCRGPVRIGCPLHAAMSGWVFVFEHPYFAVTDARGKFKLPPLPPGKYRLHIHHASGDLKQSRELIVEKDKPLTLSIELGKKPPKEQRR